MSDQERDNHLPDKARPDEIPEFEPEIIPPDEPPFGDFDRRPSGYSGLFRLNLNCCGCSGTTIVLFIVAVVVALIVYFRR